jgi:hypothetical protein
MFLNSLHSLGLRRPSFMKEDWQHLAHGPTSFLPLPLSSPPGTCLNSELQRRYTFSGGNNEPAVENSGQV